MSDAPPTPRKKAGILRWVLRIAVACLLLAVTAVLARNFLIRKGAEAAVTEVTGFPFTIDSFDLGLLDARVSIRGMTLRNPPGFEDPRCISIPTLVADIEPKTLLHETLHIEELILDVREVVVVRNAAGETNLDRLKALVEEKKDEGKGPAEAKGGAKERKDAGSAEGGKKHRWKCDRLELSLGKVVYLDYSKLKDGKPKEEIFDLKVEHEVFRNIHDPKEIVKIIVLKILKGTPIRMLNATVESLTSGLKEVTSGIGDAVGSGVKGIGDAIGGLFGGKKDEEPPPPPKNTKKKR